MPKQFRIAVIVLAFALGGCGGGASDLSKIVRDYSEINSVGAVRPIEQPIKVSIGPVRSFSAVIEYHTAVSTGDTDHSSMSFSGSIEEIDGKYMFRLRLTGITTKDNSWTPPEPIAEAECWLDGTGRPFGEPKIHLSDRDQASRRPSDDETENMRAIMTMMLITGRPLAGTYSRGTEVNILPAATMQRFNKPPPGFVWEKYDFALRAEGIVTRLKRPAVLARYAGGAVAHSESTKDELSMKADGHRLADQRTGLPLSWVLRMAGSGFAGGNPVTAEAVWVWKVTGADFPPQPPGRAAR